MWTRHRRRRKVLRDYRTRRAQAAFVPPSDTPPARSARRRRARSIDAPRPLDALRRQPSRAAALIGTVLFAALATHLLTADAFRVKTAQVVGNVRVPADVVFAASGLDGTNAFRADPVAAARAIEALPDIIRADVRVVLPSASWIAVQESQCVLLWETPSGTWAIDEFARTVTAPSDATGLIRVTDESTTLPPPGQPIGIDLFDAAVQYGRRYGSLRHKKDYGFYVSSPEGWEVRLGTDASLADRQEATLDSLRQRLAGQVREVAYIDLRFASRPYFRLTSEGN